MLWASLLILAVLIVLSMVKLNSMSWMESKPCLKEVGNIILTLARLEEEILQMHDPVILPEHFQKNGCSEVVTYLQQSQSRWIIEARWKGTVSIGI